MGKNSAGTGVGPGQGERELKPQDPVGRQCPKGRREQGLKQQFWLTESKQQSQPGLLPAGGLCLGDPF